MPTTEAVVLGRRTAQHPWALYPMVSARPETLFISTMKMAPNMNIWMRWTCRRQCCIEQHWSWTSRLKTRQKCLCDHQIPYAKSSGADWVELELWELEVDFWSCGRRKSLALDKKDRRRKLQLHTYVFSKDVNWALARFTEPGIILLVICGCM